ncbi:hypothetical protein COC42_02005 [Sphingomonas spermidinifaciens]|uniref:Energy transducer TonB n=1 Tax=Sphingomonas spermidinifaciens TaxID=1141889 RepID=A0A2A4B6F2_9SPHN|nr:hypothetical protein [Sphingomonas spermidinifaciens]PCD03216.1 hypothetical protein COC42_02005 [Sphingomonas spermidinifaciens]
MPERLRGERARRIAGVVLALLVELLLVLILLTLKPDLVGREDAKSTPVFTMEAADEASPEPAAEAQPETETPPAEAETPPAETPPTTEPRLAPPVPTPPSDAPPAPSPPPYILLPRETLAQADIRRPSAPAAAPAAPARRPTYGPVDRGPPGPPDSEVVGRAPNGEPLYAAAWYREPYDDELRGYLSTASGPGYGLIACRTAPNWRVEDCVSLGESPEGSNIARSVLAAAWQFKVRPPRVGGEYRVGEWVRIRIDYGVERRRR